MSLSSEGDHRYSVRKGSKRVILLVRRQLCRDKQYFSKFKVLRRALSDCNVSPMYGIEGTAEEGQVHRETVYMARGAKLIRWSGDRGKVRTPTLHDICSK